MYVIYFFAESFSSICCQFIKDDVGTIRIQRPYKGPFYVSHKTIDQLIANLGKWARLLYAHLCMFATAQSCMNIGSFDVFSIVFYMYSLELCPPGGISMLLWG